MSTPARRFIRYGKHRGIVVVYLYLGKPRLSLIEKIYKTHPYLEDKSASMIIQEERLDAEDTHNLRFTVSQK